MRTGTGTSRRNILIGSVRDAIRHNSDTHRITRFYLGKSLFSVKILVQVRTAKYCCSLNSRCLTDKTIVWYTTLRFALSKRFISLS